MTPRIAAAVARRASRAPTQESSGDDGQRRQDVLPVSLAVEDALPH